MRQFKDMKFWNWDPTIICHNLGCVAFYFSKSLHPTRQYWSFLFILYSSSGLVLHQLELKVIHSSQHWCPWHNVNSNITQSETRIYVCQTLIWNRFHCSEIWSHLKPITWWIYKKLSSDWSKLMKTSSAFGVTVDAGLYTVCIEEGFVQKTRQRSWLLFRGQNLVNALPR